MRWEWSSLTACGFRGQTGGGVIGLTSLQLLRHRGRDTTSALPWLEPYFFSGRARPNLDRRELFDADWDVNVLAQLRRAIELWCKTLHSHLRSLISRVDLVRHQFVSRTLMKVIHRSALTDSTLQLAKK